MRRVGQGILLAVAAVGCLVGIGFQASEASDLATPAWASPSVMALKKIGPVPDQQITPDFLYNMDCSVLTYRTPDSSGMQTGCFTPTAFGLMDSDTGAVIFNGTDEGISMLSFSAHQVLVPWPNAPGLITLDAALTQGSFINLYRNPLPWLQDVNQFGQVAGKRLTEPPDTPITDGAGKPLVINPQTLAFSSDGSWLVAETLGGSFIRLNLATLDVLPFAPAYGTQGSPGLLQSSVAISDDGRYVAVANDAAAEFKVYNLSACGQSSNSQPGNCQSHDYQSFVASQVGGLQSLHHVRFINDGLLSFAARTATGTATYELAPASSITSLISYLGLGDSYTSGEGAYDYLDGTDNSSNHCHLSINSYPLLLTRDVFGNAGGHSVACSGAVINDIASQSDNYRGQVAGGSPFSELSRSPALLESIMGDFRPGFVAQQRFVKEYQPAVVTVAVGGNDIGFGDILQNCVMPRLAARPKANDCYATYEDRREVLDLIDRTIPRWAALFMQLTAQSPESRIYVIGYPDIADSRGNCAQNVHLSRSELEFAEGLIAYLDMAIEQAAQTAGVDYVDISQALVGHRLCEAASYDVAVNGLTAGNDVGLLGINIFGHESYHPTALGQALIEHAILQQTHNFAATHSPPPNNSPSDNFLNAPKTGRTVRALYPVHFLPTAKLQKGISTPINFSGLGDGLRTSANFSVRLDGGDGSVVGSASTDETATLLGNLTLSDNVPAGAHSLDIIGQNQLGNTIDLRQPVYVSSSALDLDGDGVNDAADSCPSTTNSGQDADADGIDDTCDGFIGIASASNGNNATQTSHTNAATPTSQKPQTAIHAHAVLGTATTKPLKALATEAAVGKPTQLPSLPGWAAWLGCSLVICLWLHMLVSARSLRPS